MMNVLNQPAPMIELKLNDTEAVQELKVNMSNITNEEIKRAFRSSKNNKAPGIDEISAEMLKQGDETAVEYLTDIFNDAWQKAGVTEGWTKGGW